MSTAAIVISVALLCVTLTGLGVLFFFVRKHELSIQLEREGLARSVADFGKVSTVLTAQYQTAEAKIAALDEERRALKDRVTKLEGQVALGMRRG